MSHSQSTEVTAKRDPLQRMLIALAGLTQKLGNGVSKREGIDELEWLLEALPFTTEEFDLACRRLRNARRYLVEKERGAARWELNMLKKQLQLFADLEVAPSQIASVNRSG